MLSGFSGAVQDWDRGVIVGRRSYGKGLVQQPFMLADGSLIRLTVARYYTPTGRLIQKSYENGYEEYASDLINRYNNGELTSADSIVFPESQKYQTLKLNRTVYGGGGIMPDYFVPMDTTSYSLYYRGLISRGLLNRFVLQLVDEHRVDLLVAHPTLDSYLNSYRPSKNTLDDLISFAGEEGLEFSENDWDLSNSQISLLIKAYMARDLFGPGCFYQVWNSSDDVFSKAVEILEHPSMMEEKLAKAED